MIGLLNPVIRGWANFHRHVASKQTFTKVDNAIFQALWRWARRRHPKKPLRWIKDAYSHNVGGRNWVFRGERPGKDGRPIKVRLFYASQVTIQRHVKIKGAANPYDPAWEIYFEHRLGVKMSENLRERRKLLHLWKEQDGICPVCEQPITALTGWHNHHIVRRVHGGTDRAENRVLLHPNCHTHVHHHGLIVVKPRSLRSV